MLLSDTCWNRSGEPPIDPRYSNYNAVDRNRQSTRAAERNFNFGRVTRTNRKAHRYSTNAAGRNGIIIDRLPQDKATLRTQSYSQRLVAS